jgi:hypothetical protein
MLTLTQLHLVEVWLFFFAAIVYIACRIAENMTKDEQTRQTMITIGCSAFAVFITSFLFLGLY